MNSASVKYELQFLYEAWQLSSLPAAWIHIWVLPHLGHHRYCATFGETTALGQGQEQAESVALELTVGLTY